MKRTYLLLIIFGASIGLISCEDDDPISAGIGDPLLKDIVSLDIAISTETSIVGEGNVLDFTVVLPQTFESDATITVEVQFDNGGVSTGSAVVKANQTSAMGSITMPPDDGFITGETIFGAADAAKLKAVAFLLDEPIPNTTFAVDSNTVSLGIYPDTLIAGGGLNIMMDWNGAPEIDLDMQVIDRGFTAVFENSAGGVRFESDLFQNVGRPDGIYDVYARPYTTPSTEFAVLFTLPDGRLKVITGTIPESAGDGTRIPVATFEKITDSETGVVDYINIQAL